MEKFCIASDHAGFELKKAFLEKYDNFIDLGTYTPESCDYPVFVKKLATYVTENKCKGVAICGTGIGMSIALNRYPNIHAALCCSIDMAEMSRRHNDANVLIFGARVVSKEIAFECFQKFIETPFEGGRHQRRLDMIDEADNDVKR